MSVQFTHLTARGTVRPVGDGKAIFGNLRSQVRGQGHAKGLLHKVCAYADDHDLTLTLEVQAYSPPDRGLTNAQLEVLYSRYGFVRVSKLNGRVQMVRYSQKLHAS